MEKKNHNQKTPQTCETTIKYKLTQNGIDFTNHLAGSMLSTQSPQFLLYPSVHITLRDVFISWTKQPATSSFNKMQG